MRELLQETMRLAVKRRKIEEDIENIQHFESEVRKKLMEAAKDGSSFFECFFVKDVSPEFLEKLREVTGCKVEVKKWFPNAVVFDWSE